MSEPLTTYLQDHLGGAEHAIDLVRHLRDEHPAQPLGAFASQILREIEADRETLRNLCEKLGARPDPVKEVTGWLSEKISRLKLKTGIGDQLGIFEALEFLELGVRGKLAMWRALSAASTADSRLQGLNYELLAARAESQASKVEEHRLEAARLALSKPHDQFVDGKAKQNAARN
jgi:hypothetical protein